MIKVLKASEAFRQVELPALAPESSSPSSSVECRGFIWKHFAAGKLTQPSHIEPLITPSFTNKELCCQATTYLERRFQVLAKKLSEIKPFIVATPSPATTCFAFKFPHAEAAKAIEALNTLTDNPIPESLKFNERFASTVFKVNEVGFIYFFFSAKEANQYQPI